MNFSHLQKKLYYIFFIWNKSLQYQTLKKWRDWFTRYQIYVSFTCLRFHMPCFREWHTESIDGYFSYGYILLACKKQDAPPQGRTAATSAPLPTAFRGNLLAAPRSCKLPAKLLRLVGMAVGIQAAETQVCELEIGQRSRRCGFCCLIILNGF